MTLRYVRRWTRRGGGLFCKDCVNTNVSALYNVGAMDTGFTTSLIYNLHLEEVTKSKMGPVPST